MTGFIDAAGAEALSTLHFWYETYLQRGTDAFVFDNVRGLWEDYKRYVETDMPLERRHQMLPYRPLRLHAGRGTPLRHAGTDQSLGRPGWRAG